VISRLVDVNSASRAPAATACPTVACTSPTRVGPGRNTTSPLASVPSSVSPWSSWKRSTAAVVAAVQSSSIVMS
jgi:hypothetical protein